MCARFYLRYPVYPLNDKDHEQVKLNLDIILAFVFLAFVFFFF